MSAKFGHLMEFSLFERLLDHADVEFFEVRENPARFAEAPSAICVNAEGNTLADCIADSFDSSEIFGDARADLDFEFAKAEIPGLARDGCGLLGLATGNGEFGENAITDWATKQASHWSI